MFLYAYGRIQWTTSSDGHGFSGPGGDEAVAGIHSDIEVDSITIPGSATPNIINITKNSNTGIPGMWIFKLGESTFYYTELGCIIIIAANITCAVCTDMYMVYQMTLKYIYQ